MIDLRDPTLIRPHKGRAVVPMNRTGDDTRIGSNCSTCSGRVCEDEPARSIVQKPIGGVVRQLVATE